MIVVCVLMFCSFVRTECASSRSNPKEVVNSNFEFRKKREDRCPRFETAPTSRTRTMSEGTTGEDRDDGSDVAAPTTERRALGAATLDERTLDALAREVERRRRALTTTTTSPRDDEKESVRDEELSRLLSDLRATMDRCRALERRAETDDHDHEGSPEDDDRANGGTATSSKRREPREGSPSRSRTTERKKGGSSLPSPERRASRSLSDDDGAVARSGTTTRNTVFSPLRSPAARPSSKDDDDDSDDDHLSACLREERKRNAALAEELGRPVNVHRWRRLEHADPVRYEMVCRVQRLQKRILSTADEIVRADERVREKEAEYQTLRSSLTRTEPFDDAREQLEQHERTHRDQKRRTKSLSLELELYKRKTEKLEEGLSNLAQEKMDLQNSWIEEKTKELFKDGE